MFFTKVHFLRPVAVIRRGVQSAAERSPAQAWCRECAPEIARSAGNRNIRTQIKESARSAL